MQDDRLGDTVVRKDDMPDIRREEVSRPKPVLREVDADTRPVAKGDQYLRWQVGELWTGAHDEDRGANLPIIEFGEVHQRQAFCLLFPNVRRRLSMSIAPPAPPDYLGPVAGVAQWQSRSFPS